MHISWRRYKCINWFARHFLIVSWCRYECWSRFFARHPVHLSGAVEFIRCASSLKSSRRSRRVGVERWGEERRGEESALLDDERRERHATSDEPSRAADRVRLSRLCGLSILVLGSVSMRAQQEKMVRFLALFLNARHDSSFFTRQLCIKKWNGCLEKLMRD